MMNYSLEIDLGDEGQLVVRALRTEWLQRGADLLADTFVDTLGIQPYRCVRRISATVQLLLLLMHLLPRSQETHSALHRS